MAAIFQTFSNAFSWMKMYKFRLRFHWSLFPRFQLTIFQHWFRWRLGADQATSHYLNQWWLVWWRINASLGLNELNSDSAISHDHAFHKVHYINNHNVPQSLLNIWCFTNNIYIWFYFLSISEVVKTLLRRNSTKNHQSYQVVCVPDIYWKQYSRPNAIVARY